MRKLLAISGILLIIISTVSAVQYLADYENLSDYDKGYVWGKLPLLLIGIGLAYFGMRERKADSQ